MLSIYNNTINKTTLLLANDFKIDFSSTKTVNIHLPSFKEILEENDWLNTLQMLHNSDFWSNGLFIAKSDVEALYGFFKNPDLWEIIVTTIQKFLPSLEYENGSFYTSKELLTDEEIQLLLMILYVGCGFETYESYEELLPKNEQSVQYSDEELLWREKINRANARIRQIKNNAKKQEQQKLDLASLTICILHYFPQYNLTTIGQLNYYTVLELYSWALKMQIEPISNIAAALGGVKNYKPLF